MCLLVCVLANYFMFLYSSFFPPHWLNIQYIVMFLYLVRWPCTCYLSIYCRLVLPLSWIKPQSFFFHPILNNCYHFALWMRTTLWRKCCFCKALKGRAKGKYMYWILDEYLEFNGIKQSRCVGVHYALMGPLPWLANTAGWQNFRQRALRVVSRLCREALVGKQIDQFDKQHVVKKKL